MDHPRKFEHQDISYQSLGIDVSSERAKEVMPPMINVEGGNDGGDQFWPKSDLGRATGEDSSFVGTGAPGAKNEGKHKGYGDQDQPTLPAETRTQHLQDDADISMICRAFSQLKLEDLDHVFQCTQFPNIFVRNEVGMPTSVEPEAESVGHSEPEEELLKQSF
ncbi:uncharacterized protein LOC194854 [Mus musculus]|uniref:Predicted gene 9 n=1 Tax=Mus musculus TaxID=10090 RepID=Q3UKW5_MOUSE|nr:uncharacterized protein LOC194854 [Mus musculus]EDL28996.1 mCG10360 [Mus musculus]BAE20750.1 unnamed protein product [Mus musculus]BAE26686.1 unnamed protein product [Mus musculus]|eukprot:NP_001028406.1 uncharacterized protein LOC194854 [Mus musculus]